MSRGGDILRSLLRRQQAMHGSVNSEVVLVGADPLLIELPAQVEAIDQVWSTHAVQGPLSLRAALTAPGPYVLVIESGVDVPLDVAHRAWLGRNLSIEARDVVAALTGRHCGRLDDTSVFERLRADLEGFAARAAQWSFRGQGAVHADDVEAILAGSTRPGMPADELLAHWILQGPPAHGSAQGITAPLSMAVTAEGLARLMLHGALAAVPRLLEAPPIKGAGSLVASAVAIARRVDAASVERALAPAEARAADADLTADEAGSLRLLKAGLDALETHICVRLCEAAGVPDAWLSDREAHTLRDAATGLIDDLLTLDAFASDTRMPDDVKGWARWASRECALADRQARAVRRQAATASGLVAAAVVAVQTRYLSRRDAQNARFARQLAETEVHTFRRGALREGVPVHLITRAVVKPLVEEGARVLLVVFDGCDWSTFHEIVEALDLHWRRPGGALAKAFADGPLTALSPVPTITAVGRRAIFGGEIPANAILTTEEAFAADASGDATAFKRNPAMKGLRSRLFLKGDLGPEAQAVRAAIAESDLQVIAVVFNVIDDALSSKEMTAMGPWHAGSLGRGVVQTLKDATAAGWTIVATSDHGHTPHWDRDRKVKAKGRGGQRYRVGERPVGQRFARCAWRPKPVHALTTPGGYLGPQNRGYHGGAGVEEVCVPLAIVGVGPAEVTPVYRPAPEPAPVVDAPEPAPVVESVPAAEVGSEVSEAPAPVAAEAPAWLDQVPADMQSVVAHLDRFGAISEVDLHSMLGTGRQVRRFVRKVHLWLADAPFAVESENVSNINHFVKKPRA